MDTYHIPYYHIPYISHPILSHPSHIGSVKFKKATLDPHEGFLHAAALDHVLLLEVLLSLRLFLLRCLQLVLLLLRLEWRELQPSLQCLEVTNFYIQCIALERLVSQ